MDQEDRHQVTLHARPNTTADDPNHAQPRPPDSPPRAVDDCVGESVGKGQDDGGGAADPVQTTQQVEPPLDVSEPAGQSGDVEVAAATTRKRRSDVFGPAPPKKKKLQNLLTESEHKRFHAHVASRLNRKLKADMAYLRKAFPHMDDVAINREVRRATEHIHRKATHKHDEKALSATKPKKAQRGMAKEKPAREHLVAVTVEKAAIEAQLEEKKASIQRAVATLMPVVGLGEGAATDGVDLGDLDGVMRQFESVVAKARQELDKCSAQIAKNASELESQRVDNTDESSAHFASIQVELAQAKDALADLEKKHEQERQRAATQEREAQVEKDQATARHQKAQKELDKTKEALAGLEQNREYERRRAAIEEREAQAEKDRAIARHAQAKVELDRAKAALANLNQENEELTVATVKAMRQASEAEALKKERDQWTRHAAALEQDRMRLESQLEVFETCTLMEKALNTHRLAFCRALDGNFRAQNFFSCDLRKSFACVMALLITHRAPRVQRFPSRFSW